MFPPMPCFVFFFNDTATTEIYTLSLHDALPISPSEHHGYEYGDCALLICVSPSNAAATTKSTMIGLRAIVSLPVVVLAYPADSGDCGQVFRLIADRIPIDRGQHSDDRGQRLPSTASMA